MDTKDYLEVYSSLCMKCGHLNPDEPKKYSKCHFSKGNEDCPASEIQIVVVGRARKYARQVIAARNARNPDAEANILQMVQKQSPAFIERFYYYLESRDRGDDQ